MGRALRPCLHSIVRPCVESPDCSRSRSTSAAPSGGHLGAMLLQLSDRGPDSAGVAVYRDPAPAGSSKVSLFSPDPEQDWGAVRDALARAVRRRRAGACAPATR